MWILHQNARAERWASSNISIHFVWTVAKCFIQIVTFRLKYNCKMKIALNRMSSIHAWSLGITFDHCDRELVFGLQTKCIRRCKHTLTWCESFQLKLLLQMPQNKQIRYDWKAVWLDYGLHLEYTKPHWNAGSAMEIIFLTACRFFCGLDVAIFRMSQWKIFTIRTCRPFTRGCVDPLAATFKQTLFSPHKILKNR